MTTAIVEHGGGSDGPGVYAHTSTTYVWPGSLNLAVHIMPPDLTHEAVQLGTITRATYHALEAIVGGVDINGCFVMLHFEPATHNVHVTMLPVGADTERSCLDAQLRQSEKGFAHLLHQLQAYVDACTPPNGVRILYNAPADLDTPSKVAIVHELGIDHSLVRKSLAQFIAAITPQP